LARYWKTENFIRRLTQIKSAEYFARLPSTTAHAASLLDHTPEQAKHKSA
jgi:hypothetical protein